MCIGIYCFLRVLYISYSYKNSLPHFKKYTAKSPFLLQSFVHFIESRKFYVNCIFTLRRPGLITLLRLGESKYAIGTFDELLTMWILWEIRCNDAPWKGIVPSWTPAGRTSCLQDARCAWHIFCCSGIQRNYECARKFTNAADRHLAHRNPRIIRAAWGRLTTDGTEGRRKSSNTIFIDKKMIFWGR